jgi:hypothetical protein
MHPVRDVEADMERHAHQRQYCGTLPPTEKQEQHRDRRMVQTTSRCMLGRVRLRIEAHGGHWVQPTVARHEPQIVVDVDDDAGSPGHHHGSTEAGVEERGGTTGERNMVSNAH